MIESFKEWIGLLIKDGCLCDAYQEKLKKAHSKAAIMDICLDANGISYLCYMSQLGYGLPRSVIHKEFGKYLNGRYISKRMKNGKLAYSGSIYCDNDEDTTINTTCTAFLGCVKNVFVKENEYVSLYADSSCILTVFCPKSSRCYVDCYGSATVVDANKFNNIIITYK